MPLIHCSSRAVHSVIAAFVGVGFLLTPVGTQAGVEFAGYRSSYECSSRGEVDGRRVDEVRIHLLDEAPESLLFHSVLEVGSLGNAGVFEATGLSHVEIGEVRSRRLRRISYRGHFQESLRAELSFSENYLVLRSKGRLKGRLVLRAMSPFTGEVRAVQLNVNCRHAGLR